MLSSARVGGVKEPHGQRGAGDLKPLGQGEQPVASQRLAEVQRPGQRGTPQPRRAARGQHRHVKALLHTDQAGRAQSGSSSAA